MLIIFVLGNKRKRLLISVSLYFETTSKSQSKRYSAVRTVSHTWYDTDLSEFFLSIKIIIVLNLKLGVFVCALGHTPELGSSLIN